MNKIVYPRGSGGSWLSNLIWHLEHNNTDLPQVDMVFDYTPKCSIKFDHGISQYNPVIFRPKTLETMLFSSKHLFTHYLNDATKVRYHIQKLHNRSELEQFRVMSNSAIYFLTNKEYQAYYCDKIDLDYSIIFQDPVEFINRLFVLLNNCDIKYTQNREYALSSIAYYRNTVTNPEQHYNNPASIIYLGYCHAITLMDNLPLTGIITDIRSAQTLLEPYFELCADRIKPELLKWK